VHLAIPGGALALIIAWHAARGKGGFGVIGGGGKWGRGCEKGGRDRVESCNGKWKMGNGVSTVYEVDSSRFSSDSD